MVRDAAFHRGAEGGACEQLDRWIVARAREVGFATIGQGTEGRERGGRYCPCWHGALRTRGHRPRRIVGNLTR